MRTPNEWISFADQKSQTLPFLIDGTELWLMVLSARKAADRAGTSLSDEDLDDTLNAALELTMATGRGDWRGHWFDILRLLLQLKLKQEGSNDDETPTA